MHLLKINAAVVFSILCFAWSATCAGGTPPSDFKKFCDKAKRPLTAPASAAEKSVQKYLNWQTKKGDSVRNRIFPIAGFDMCGPSTNPKIIAFQKTADSADSFDKKGMHAQANALREQSKTNLVQFMANIQPPPTPPVVGDGKIVLLNFCNWARDIKATADLIGRFDPKANLADAQKVVFQSYVDAMNAWGEIEMEMFMETLDQEAVTGTLDLGLVKAVLALGFWLDEMNDTNASEQGDQYEPHYVSDFAERLLDYVRAVLKNLVKGTSCSPDRTSFVKTGKVIQVALDILEVQMQSTKTTSAELATMTKDLENELNGIASPVNANYIRSLASNGNVNKSEWDMITGFVDDNINDPGLGAEIKAHKVLPPDCYGWIGTIKYSIYWNGVHTSSSKGPGYNCENVKSSWIIKDTMDFKEVITFPGKKINAPVADLKCRQIGINTLHSESTGCGCRCGKYGTDECYYSYNSDLPNWIIESNVTAPPEVSVNFIYDPIHKIVKVCFENGMAKYLETSRNGKEQYTKINSQCPGLPGKPMDLTNTTKDEGYAYSDTCALAYDPISADRIVGKCHSDKPKDNGFGQAFYDAWKKGVEAGGGTFNYQLNKYSCDVEVDLRKVLLK